MSAEEWFAETKQWFKEQSNSKLIFAALIIIGVIYVAFGFGYDAEYHEEVEIEKRWAQAICENSYEWVMADTQRLKLGKSDLRNVKVNGRKVKLEHIQYPEVLFLDSGISKITIKGGGGATAEDLFCTFKDPRGSGEYFYNYENRQWVDKARFRR